jgi:hypothetical protein
MVTKLNPSCYHVDWCNFGATSEVWTSAILERLKLRDLKYGFEVTLNGITYLLHFMKIYHLIKSVLVGGWPETEREADSMVIS